MPPLPSLLSCMSVSSLKTGAMAAANDIPFNARRHRLCSVSVLCSMEGLLVAMDARDSTGSLCPTWIIVSCGISTKWSCLIFEPRLLLFERAPMEQGNMGWNRASRQQHQRSERVLFCAGPHEPRDLVTGCLLVCGMGRNLAASVELKFQRRDFLSKHACVGLVGLL